MRRLNLKRTNLRRTNLRRLVERSSNKTRWLSLIVRCIYSGIQAVLASDTKILQRLTLVVLVLTLSIPAVPGHDLPPVVEEYRLLATEWEVRSGPDLSSDETYYLSATKNRKTYSWKIEPGWIAQSVKGNDVPTEAINSVTMDHVKNMIGKKGDLIFKVASLAQGGDLFVRSMKILNLEESFERASKLGSPILSLESNGVRKLGFSEYSKRVAATTDQDWQRVDARKASK